MGCSNSSTVNDNSHIWTNIEAQAKSTENRQRGDRSLGSTRPKIFDGTQAISIKNKRYKTYFEPCLLYITEPEHKNYQLNDLGLYEQDTDFGVNTRKSTQQKRPKCSGVWIDNAFDETKFKLKNDFKLIRANVSNNCLTHYLSAKFYTENTENLKKIFNIT